MIRRVSNRWRRFAIEHFVRREFRLDADRAFVSFTFDDFPRTALTEGGRVLAEHGARGTYFVSLKLVGGGSPSGPIASWRDVEQVVHDGHELGCHTFAHVDGSKVTPDEFERSIEINRLALDHSGIDAYFDVFAYPLDGPALGTKRVAARYFSGCRGGGQTFNSGVIDLNLLKAYFLDARSRERGDEAKQLIGRNADAKGWLIFATHDVSRHPSAYGCSTADFDSLVRMAAESGATLLPMTAVCRALGIVQQGSARPQ